MLRRQLLTTPLLLCASVNATAQQRRSLANPLRLGVDGALIESGLARRFQQRFGRDTGVVVELVPASSAAVLKSLEEGEIDASMTTAPDLEQRLERQGLAQGRLRLAVGERVLVGPTKGRGKLARDPLGLMGGKDVVAALRAIAAQQAPFVSANDGSGTHLAEQALWRAAQVAPAAPWFVESPPGTSVLAHAAALGGYALLDRGVWLAAPRAPMAVVTAGDTRLASEVHVMRGFRSRHPATKLFMSWTSGPQGRRVASGVAGWRAG